MSHCQELCDRTSNPDTNWELLSFVKRKKVSWDFQKVPGRKWHFRHWRRVWELGHKS